MPRKAGWHPSIITDDDCDDNGDNAKGDDDDDDDHYELLYPFLLGLAPMYFCSTVPRQSHEVCGTVQATYSTVMIMMRMIMAIIAPHLTEPEKCSLV